MGSISIQRQKVERSADAFRQTQNRNQTPCVVFEYREVFPIKLLKNP